MVKLLITDKDFEGVCDFNKNLMKEFLNNNTQLSEKTRITYLSSLRVFFWWVKENLNNKRIVDFKTKDFLSFQNYLVNRDCSSGDVNSKRAAVSSLLNYLILYYEDEFPTLRNFVKLIPPPPKAAVYEKRPMTQEEFDFLINKLTEKKEYMQVAYLMFALETGARRGEIRQVKRNVVNTSPITKVKDGKTTTSYETDFIRAKGKGKQGKQKKFIFGEQTMGAFKKWLEQRDETFKDNNEFMFVHKVKNVVKQISDTTANNYFTNYSKWLGYNLHPHSTRFSRATMLANSGVDIKKIQKLLSHESSATTEIYIIKNENENLEDLLFD